MPQQFWWVWMCVAVIFVVAEIFTAGFFIFWFGIGAAIAGLLALAGLSALWQWLTFVAVTAVLVAVTQRFANRFSKAQPPGIGADRYAGQIGIVLEEINNDANTGRVRIEKEEWRADSRTGTTIPAGTRVRVVNVTGTRLLVEPVGEEK